MAATLKSQALGGRITRMALLSGLGLIAVFVEAAPLGVPVTAIPSPDLLLCVVAAVALRRPEAAPVLLICALGLVRDLLTDAPVGAGALSLVLFAEWLRQRSASYARRSVFAEWLAVCVGALAVLALQWVLVFLSFAQPPFLLDLVRVWVLTVLAYPVVLLIVRWGFGIRWRPLPTTRERR